MNTASDAPTKRIRLVADDRQVRRPIAPLLGKLALLLVAVGTMVFSVRWAARTPIIAKAAEMFNASELAATNVILLSRISDCEARIKAADELNVSLRVQLDSVTVQLSNALMVTRATGPGRASREAIRALRKFHTQTTSAASYEECERGFRELKSVLEENRPTIPEGEFKTAIAQAFHDFEDAFNLWGAALQKSSADFQPILEKRGWWHGKKGDFRFDKFVKANGREPTDAELRSLNTPLPGFALEYNLKKITEEALAQIDLAESKL